MRRLISQIFSCTARTVSRRPEISATSYRLASTFTDNHPLASRAESLFDEATTSRNESSRTRQLAEAAELAKEGIEEGSIRARTVLGVILRDGYGDVPADRTRAAELLAESAEAGDPAAQCAYGALLAEEAERDEDVDENAKAALANAGIVMESTPDGSLRGRMEVSDNDFIDRTSPAELVRRVRKARKKAGFTDMEARQFEEYKLMQQREEQKKKVAEAERWLSAAAEQGNDIAMVALGNRCLYKDPLRAIQYYEKAVKTSRNTDAYFNLGQIYTQGMPGVSKDPKKAFKNFAMAAQLGDASAQFYLGHLYRTGAHDVEHDTEVDLPQALQYVQLAAAQEHPGAVYYLALMHRNGEAGLEESLGTFRRYVHLAASLGHPPAMMCLADMYHTGTDGVEVDNKKALEFFLKAGQAGDADAMCSAAAMHFHGHGTTQDKHQALLLYQEAVVLGSIAALRNLGAMYFHGDGVPKNLSIAEQFFQVADEEQKERDKAMEEHLQEPIFHKEAPPHPMSEIPEFIKRGSR